MKGYIIETYNNMGNAYVAARLMEEAEKRNVELAVIGVKDTMFYEGAAYNNGQRIEQRDFIINRYKWGKIKNEINRLGKRAYNEPGSFGIYVNKYEQIKRLESKYFKKPKYILGNSCLHYDSLSELLGGRVIAKGLENSMGREIFLVEKEADMEQLRAYDDQKEWLFEEFIETSYGKDLRIFSIRGEVAGCMKRQARSDFRANVALGANHYKYEITDEIREIARDIYSQTGLDFVGIDLLFGKNGFYFCEINVMPGLKGIEETTGINVAGQIMEMICEDFQYE